MRNQIAEKKTENMKKPKMSIQKKWFESINIGRIQLYDANRHDHERRKMINKRNTRLYALFRMHYDNVRLIGSSDNPIVIINNMYAIPSFCKNFDFHIKGNPFPSSEVIHTIRLSEENCISGTINLPSLLKDIDTFFKVYLLKNEFGMYFAGMNTDPEERKTPVFSYDIPRVYTHREKAENLQSELQDVGYKLNIVECDGRGSI